MNAGCDGSSNLKKNVKKQKKQNSSNIGNEMCKVCLFGIYPTLTIFTSFFSMNVKWVCEPTKNYGQVFTW